LLPIDDVMPNLDNLPVEDRLKLVQDLWDSIAADTGDVPVDPEHIAEIRKRLAAYRSDLARGERARDVAEAIRRNL
jgi:putative addiction module component (TIGR02574 family)